MANIKVNQNIEGGAGGTDFVQQGTSVANTLAPDAIAAVAEGVKDIFVIGKKEQAATESKSLLEELTGNKRLVDIAQREQAVFGREEEVANEIAQSTDVLGNTQTTAAMEQIQGMKDQLSREREAVVQGLLTNDEYRIRAETSFYQMVAMTPGIKTELAKVMSEHLGIDPRGQTAAVTMAARDDITAKTDTATKKIIGELVSSGFYDSNLTERANIVKYWDHVKGGMQAQNELKVLTDKINAQGTIDDAEKAIVAKQATTWVNKAEQRSLYNMGGFKGQNLFDLTPEEIVNMDPETRAQWAANIQAQAVEFSGVLNSLETSTGQSFATNRDTVSAQQELLMGIINSDQLNDILTSNLAIGKARNDILVEAAKAEIAMSQPQAVQLAAYGKFFNISNMLSVNVAGSTMVLRGLNGDIPNLANLTQEDKAATIDMYNESVKGVSLLYSQDPKSFNDADIGNAGNVATMVANQDPADLGSMQPSLQLFRLAAGDGFMDRLDGIDPIKADILRKGVIKHQKAVGQNYNQEISTVLENNDAENLDSLDFHIENIEGQWMVVPNSDVDAALMPSRIGTPLPDQLEMLSRKDAQFIAQKKNSMTVALNRTRGMISNMVESRAASTGLPLSEAAKQVAQDLGISTVDGEAPKAGAGGAQTSKVSDDDPVQQLMQEIKSLKEQLGKK